MCSMSSDVDLFRREGAKIGLQLNVGKCEVISKVPFNPDGSLAGYCTLRPADAIIMGAPLALVQPQITPSKQGVQTFVWVVTRCFWKRTSFISSPPLWVH